MNRPRRGNSKAEDNTNSAWFHNRGKSLIKINTMLLGKTATNPSSFVTSKSTVSVKFMLKNPFAGNNINTGWFGNKSPCVILLEGIKFITHGGKPKRIQKSTFVCGGNERNCRSGREIKSFGWKKKAAFATCAHDMIIGRRWNGDGIRW